MKDGENIAIRAKITMIQLPVNAFWLFIIPMNQRERILFWDVAFSFSSTWIKKQNSNVNQPVRTKDGKSYRHKILASVENLETVLPVKVKNLDQGKKNHLGQ